jgi:hypothetical protein
MRDTAADAINRRAACAAAGLSPDRGLAGYELFRRRILGMLRKSAAARLAFCESLHARSEASCDAAWRALGWFDPIK